MNDVMKLLRQISDTCQLKRCMECEFCSENTGICIFADMPIFWNHQEIEKSLKKILNE